MSLNTGSELKLIKGRVFAFVRAPVSVEDYESFIYCEDGAIVVENGSVLWAGNVVDLPERYRNLPTENVHPHLIMPGFLDAHTHYPQMEVVGSFGEELMPWLNNYTFPQEMRLADEGVAANIATAFLGELIRNGVTTASVFGSVHKHSVDVLFARAEQLNMRMIAGKVLMDRNAPEPLLDTAKSGYDDSAELVKRWHGKKRLSYAVTPRFAITSSPEQLEVAGDLLQISSDLYLQTHLSESEGEIESTLDLFPESKDYLGVYDRFGLVSSKSLFAHCIHLNDEEIIKIKESNAVSVFCPTSNSFLGSGLYDYSRMKAGGVSIAYGTDVGAGTSYSMLATMSESYKICKLQGYSLSPLESFYRATLGGAIALSLSHKIGSIKQGLEADFVVLNSSATPAMAVRMSNVDDIVEELFVLQTMGDDRSVAATYIAGTEQKHRL